MKDNDNYNFSTLKEAYDSISRKRKRFGVLKKCEFHIHTPASYDYRLFDEWDSKEYKNIKETELLDVAVSIGYINEENKSYILKDIDKYNEKAYLDNLNKNGFKDFKEYFTYLLIAHVIYSNEIDVAVISDHNTFNGYKKLKKALDDYFQKNKFRLKSCVYLFLGVEISCSERNHVIGIIDDSKYDKVKSWLSDIIISEEEGTYCNTLEVIKSIRSFGGVGYIAHANSSKLYGSKAYKKMLFGNVLNTIGITNIDKKESVIERIKPFNNEIKEKCCFLLEGDSHALDTIGTRNTWIKFSEINFKSLVNSLKDFKVCVFLEKPNKSDKFIKGMYIIPGEYGFLKGYNKECEENFVVDFSSDLNCIIGGRGTGKTTLLNIIEIILTLDCYDLETLKFISKHKIIYIVFHLNDSDYIIRFIPQIKDIYDDEDDVSFLPKAFYFKNHNKLSYDWRELFRVDGDKFYKIDDNKEAAAIINDFYKRSYSINKLVSKIQNNLIGEFIKDIVMYGIDYNETKKYRNEMKRLNSVNVRKYLRTNLNNMMLSYENQKRVVESKISGFNEVFQEQLKIVYSSNDRIQDYYLKDILELIDDDKNVMNTFLKWYDVVYFINELSQSMGYIKFLDCLLNSRYSEIEQYLSLKDMVDEESITSREINKGLEHIDKSNINKVYATIRAKLTNKDNYKVLTESIDKWFEVNDDFTIKFNVNFKETIQDEKSVFKDIKEISLGQQVAALLAFVFNFGKFVSDNTPLIIDQPEDNLDNQYIYKNLVESLRRIKNERQVIIVTHNSAIVTNADSEQVIVMDSNNINGWIQSAGYPTNKTIVWNIINYLEGGAESFSNKYNKYKNFLK